MAETATLTLTDFLLARIAEDEEHASMAPKPGTSIWNGAQWVAAQWSPARVLAECEAKRRMVTAFERCSFMESTAPHPDQANVSGAGADSWHAALRLLALPYADHPDYREEWRV